MIFIATKGNLPDKHKGMVADIYDCHLADIGENETPATAKARLDSAVGKVLATLKKADPAAHKKIKDGFQFNCHAFKKWQSRNGMNPRPVLGFTDDRAILKVMNSFGLKAGTLADFEIVHKKIKGH